MVVFVCVSAPSVPPPEAFVAILYYVLTGDADLINVDYDRECAQYHAWRSEIDAYNRKRSRGEALTAQDEAWKRAADGTLVDTYQKFRAHIKAQR